MNEGGWFDSEAIETERHDADAEMAELESVGRAHSAARKAGRCTHGWWQGRQSDGVQTCLHCGAMFQGEAELFAAQRAAVTG
jgi:hypothetical protein